MSKIFQQDADPSAVIAKREIAPASGELGTGQRAADYVVDVHFLLVAIWRGKWIILAAALIGLFYGGWKLHTYVPVYEAHMIVAPGSRDSGSSLASGGAASVARTFGIAVTQASRTTTFDRLEILLGSLILAERLQEKYGLMQRVFSGSWDDEAGQWTKPTGVRFERRERLNRFFKRSTWREPSLETLSAYLDGALNISSDMRRGVKRISFRHQDRDYALFLLKTVYEEADGLLRAQDRIELARRKAYIGDQLNEVSLTERRVVLINLLSNVENRLMLLGSGLPYAARVLEPSRASLQPLSPATGKIIGVPVALALFLGTLIVLLIRVFKPH